MILTRRSARPGRAAAVVVASVTACVLAAMLSAQGPPPAATPQQGQAPAPSGQAGAFRSGIELVSLDVTVTDGAGRYVTDLNQADFSVFEDGVKQDIAFFTRTSLPLSLSLLVDSSTSMDEKMDTVRKAAGGFVARLRPEDRTQIVAFDSKVNVLVPFTSLHADLDRAIASLSARSSTALFNAVYIALKELKKSKAEKPDDLRREAIILLTDGQDTSSLLSFEEVLEQTKRSETAIYAIGLRAEDSDIGKGYSDAEFVLRQLTNQSGGRVFFPKAVAELAGIYDQIWQELSSQYLVAYSSRNPVRNGLWRRVSVRTDRPDTVSRTRLGYYAPSR